MVPVEKRSSTCDRQSSGRSASVISTASTICSTVEHRYPVFPWVTTSGTAPSGRAITGVPYAIASVITSPKGSGQSMGNSMARARPTTSTFTSWVGWSRTSTSPFRRGTTTVSQYACSAGSVRFTIITRGRFAPPSDFHGHLGSLLGADPTHEAKKASLTGLNGWASRFDAVVDHARVAQLRIGGPLGVADGDQVDPIVYGPEEAPGRGRLRSVQRVDDRRPAGEHGP